MKKLLSNQEFATKLGITIIKVEQLTEIGLRRVDGTDLFSWYQVKKFLQKKESFMRQIKIKKNRKEIRKFVCNLLSHMGCVDRFRFAFTGNYWLPLRRTLKNINKKRS